MSRTSVILFAICCSFIVNLLAHAASPSWASVNMTVPDIMQDLGFGLFWSQLPLTFGSPPQTMDLTVNLCEGLIAASSIDCIFCPGSTFFTTSDSSTLQPGNLSWSSGSKLLQGSYMLDNVGFGGLRGSEKTNFVVIDAMSYNFSARINNGQFGAFVDDTNSTLQSAHLFSQLWEEGELLNPVLGFRFDPRNPKVTLGALDPADYEGTINWVQIEPPQESWLYQNVFKIDGIKGYNGSFLPFGDSLLANVNSLYTSIAVPPSNPYALNDNYTGPIDIINLNPDGGGFAYLCNDTSLLPYVALTISINGVDYQIDSANNMLHPTSGFAAPGFCNVALDNTTVGEVPEVALGLPFLRSVYLAYRFPTADCPGYYGFAFPSGANRTQSQIAQQPTSTASMSAQCLALQTPTSTPSPFKVTPQPKAFLQGLYPVYGSDSSDQVPLVGADELPKKTWNTPT